jgi:hypothetical protein
VPEAALTAADWALAAAAVALSAAVSSLRSVAVAELTWDSRIW